MVYHDFEYTRPRGSQGRNPGAIKAGRFRRQLVGQALGTGVGEIQRGIQALSGPVLRPPRAGGVH